MTRIEIPTVPEALQSCTQAYTPEEVRISSGRLIVAMVAADNSLQHDIDRLNIELMTYVPGYDGQLDTPALRQHFRDGLTSL